MYFFRYASLYFCCAIDADDNELIVLEILHRYVELLDKYFGSVSDTLCKESNLTYTPAVNRFVN